MRSVAESTTALSPWRFASTAAAIPAELDPQITRSYTGSAAESGTANSAVASNIKLLTSQQPPWHL